VSKSRKHIAVIRLSALGDVAMTVPVLIALTQKYPELKVTMISRGFFKPMFDRIPGIDFVDVKTRHRHKGFFGIIRLYRDVLKSSPDALADLHNVVRSRILGFLFWLAGKNTARTSKARSERKALVRAKEKIFEPLLPVIRRHAKTFARLGYPLDMEHPWLLPQEAMPQMFHHPEFSRRLGIAPFAQHEAKVYPKDLLQQIIDQIAKDQRVLVLLFGGPSEIKSLESFARQKPNIKVVAGSLSFSEELSLISNLDAMLSMDSGNAHLAAIYGVPTVTLWGATHPYSGFAPYNQPLENTFTSDRGKYPLLPTSIYGNKIVPGYEDAMRTINPEKVVSRIQEILFC
jgi:ADP-heptose:LPS heptosyltransferase